MTTTTEWPVIPTKGGIESYGLYTELIRYRIYDDGTENFDTHVRLFILENCLAMYQRSQSRKSGRWQVRYYDDFAAAKSACLEFIKSFSAPSRFRVVTRGEPLLIQATTTDVMIVRKKDRRGPDGRWRGINALDAKFGKVTNDSQPGVPA